MDGFGDRLKAWRDTKQLKQPEMATLLGMSPSTYQKYETHVRAPGAEAIEGFVRAGLNANWLLTGQGPMLLADLVEHSAAVSGSFDLARFRLAIEATEEGLQAAGRTMAPAKKAELFLAVYDLLEEPSITKVRILKLVKSAA